jgi:hypothetical protein
MRGWTVRQRAGGYRPARRGASDVDGATVRDRDEPGLDIGVGGQVSVGVQGGQKRLRPGVLGVDRTDDGSADSQHRRAVLGHYLFERAHLHIM